MTRKQGAADAVASLALPLTQLTEQLASFIAEIRAALPSEAVLKESPQAKYSAEALRAVVDGLRLLLAASNIQSQVYLENHRLQALQALGGEDLVFLTWHVEVYAFDKALAILQLQHG